jgi:hypothetical protein
MGGVCDRHTGNSRGDARMSVNPLWELREWVTIDETAEILSAGPGASHVSIADVFRLGLDGVLKLSVKLADTNAACFEQNKTDGPARRATINGLWDLPMIGPGQRQVEHEYHHHRGLPFISMEGTPGAFVERDGLVCRVPADPGATGFSPRGASALPPDAVIVVRTAALRELQDMLLRVRVDAARESFGHPVSPPAPQGQIDDTKKTLGSRERATLLTIVAALAKAAGIDVSKPSKAGGAIEALTTDLGARVSARTIEDHLKDIPDALERRGKASN